MSLALVQLASLDLIRGFVAVGRRMSITLAAQDLCLTQSAVSRQIHHLESHLGVKLLVRGHRSIGFTAEGERLFRSADAALQQLQDVLGDLQANAARRPVTLSASIGFIGLWLLPRLSRFQQLHPNVDFRVSANAALADLRHEGIDLAVRYTSAAKAPPGALRLVGEVVAPVAHPTLGIGTLDKLAELTLLEFDAPDYPWLQWQGWLEASGRPEARPKGMLRFNQYDLVIQATLAGQGVALGRLELIRPLLDDGRLVLLDAPREAGLTQHAHWLIQADEQPREAVRCVVDWLKSEAGACDGPGTAAP